LQRPEPEKTGGAPPGFTTEKIAQLQALAADSATSIAEILDTLKISRSTYHRYRKTLHAMKRLGTSKE
jgi:DNA-binding IclR family transcriptional regulator